MAIKTLYTAVGRFERRTNGCNRSCPIILLGGQEYMVDMQEMVIWSMLNWRILRWDDIAQEYEKLSTASGYCTFATAHHSLVYKFLNENRLPEDEFYDVVIFGYLKAVRDYFSDLTAQQFTFSTIANRRMKFCLFDYFRTQERRKRNMEILSIHVGLYPDGAPLEDTIPAHDPIMQQLEMDLLLHELAGRVSKQQMDIVHLKQGGYGIREIARTQKVPMRRIKELLAEVHDVLLDICYG